jgi:septal ring factor EnvC (AmiA/AmiB activator)
MSDRNFTTRLSVIAGLIVTLIGIIAFTYMPINTKLNALMETNEKSQSKQQELEVRINVLETRYDNLEKLLSDIKADLEYIKKRVK